MNEPINYSNLDCSSITDITVLREAIKYWQEQAVQSEYKYKIIQFALTSNYIKDIEKVETIIELMKE